MDQYSLRQHRAKYHQSITDKPDKTEMRHTRQATPIRVQHYKGEEGLESIEEGENGTPDRSNFTARHRPRSRPKLRCPKRLRHPLNKNRGERQKRAHFTVTRETNDLRRGKKETIRATQTEGRLSSEKEQPLADGRKAKLKSRPKRRCRFGPRARRAQDPARRASLQQQEGRTQTTRTKQGTEEAAPFLRTEFPTPDSLPLDNPQSLARVTLQRAECTRRTLFDHYKAKSGNKESEVDSSKFAARRLGISESEFEDALTTEINELLGEIEAARLEAQHNEKEESGSVLEPSTTEEKGGGERYL